MKAVDQVYDELKKTVLVCANCHSEHHSGGNNWTELDIEKRRFLRGLEEAKKCETEGKEFKKPEYTPRLKVVREVIHSTKNRFKIVWPEDSELLQLVQNQSMLSLSKKLGVSSNAIKKRCRIRGIKTGL